MKYDDAAWHYGGTFPSDLAHAAGATHIGMFIAWALLTGLAGRIHLVDFPEWIPRLQSRSVTPGAFLLLACDGKFTDEDINDSGNAFARDYYEDNKDGYLADYEAVVGAGLSDLYYVGDTWENFDRLRPVLDRRYEEWRNGARGSRIDQR